ncbi:MAG: 50S ribosomal protein L9, partial [Candidatus Caldatribacteriota bacterium]|nr:50S ribosomal protein L9 [Candidatus Caldatribacteriota bacterium]
MKIILKENIDKIGKIGDVLEVNDGFARNFLLPKGKAVLYTKGSFNQIEYLKKKDLEKRENELNEVKELADKINSISLDIKVKAGKEDKLFGSVTSKDIAEMIAKEGKIELDRKKIELKESLKKLGTYSIPINLHKGVDAHVKVNLISDSLSEPEE